MSLDESQKLTFQRSIPTVCAVMIKSSFVAKGPRLTSHRTQIFLAFLAFSDWRWQASNHSAYAGLSTQASTDMYRLYDRDSSMKRESSTRCHYVRKPLSGVVRYRAGNSWFSWRPALNLLGGYHQGDITVVLILKNSDLLRIAMPHLYQYCECMYHSHICTIPVLMPNNWRALSL